MALGVKDVIGLIITYIGTKPLGAVPLKPAIGVNIAGTPAMSVDLFAALGGIFPNLSAAIQGALTSTFNGLITSLGLDPASPFMSSPLGPIVKDLNSTINSAVADLQLSANIGIDAATREFDTAVGAWKSLTDTVVGIPPTMITGIAPENIAISSAAQAISPGVLLNNMDVALTHAVAIEQGVLQPALSTVLFDAAKADITFITSRIADATTQTARDLLGQELKNTLNQYTSAINDQLSQVNAAATEISKSINANAEMAAKIAPAATNLGASANAQAAVAAAKAKALATNTVVDTANITALNNIAQVYTNAVHPAYIKVVAVKIEEQAALVANTTITATNKLDEATANVAFDDTGYPVGVNVRNDTE